MSDLRSLFGEAPPPSPPPITFPPAYQAEPPSTDILEWLRENEPEDVYDLRDLRRALYSLKNHGIYRIRTRGLTYGGEQKFTVKGRNSTLLIVSNKSRHFLLRTLCRLRRRYGWPAINHLCSKKPSVN
jgi:hypothetical protein